MPGKLKPKMWAPGLQSSKPLAQGLAGYWPLWAGGGDTVMDLVGGNTGAITGATWATGPNGPVLEFDGSNTVAMLTAPRPVANMSVSAWVKPSTWTARDSIASDTNVIGLSRGWSIEYYNNSIRFFINSWDGNFAAFPYTTTGEWIHVVGTYDKATVRVYVNGVEGTPDTHSSDINYSTADGMYLGQGFGGNNFDGQMDNVSLHNRALSPSEIKQLYDDQYQLITPPTQIWTPNAGGAPAAGIQAIKYYYDQQEAVA